MNRAISLLIVLAYMGLMLTGCGAKNGSNDNIQNAANQTDNYNSMPEQGDGYNQRGPGRMGGFMRADLTGEVDSVSGKEITLKVIEMPNFEGRPDQRMGMRQQEGMEQEGTEQGKENRENFSLQPRDGDGRRQRLVPKIGVNDGNGETGQQPPQEDNQGRRRFAGGEGSMPPQWTPNYTGETKTITLPEGVSVTKTVMGENGMEVVDIKLEELKQGDILQIWYSEEDSSVISRVSVGNFGMRPN